jgi:pilus assembly protein Flp/PilA
MRGDPWLRLVKKSRVQVLSSTRAPSKGLAARRGTENSAMRPLKQFLANDVGATAIEYALISSLIAITIIMSLSLLGSQLSNEFSEISSALK